MKFSIAGALPLLPSFVACFSLPQLPLSSPAVQGTELTQLPLLIWHGLGDRFDADGIKEVAGIAEQINEGTYVYRVALAEDGGSDRTATFYGNLTEQIQYVCDDFAKNPILSTAPAVNALGFSQGGLFLRGYVERCNKPPVRTLVTFGSPHNGISEFQGCKAGDWLCQGVRVLLKRNAWGSFAQRKLVPAQYYRQINDSTLEPTEEYLENSNFLADVNNEREEKNETYSKNVSGLKKLALFMFANDTTVIPKESAWFADVNGTSGDVVHLKHRELYKRDWLGLKELDKKGGIDFRELPGEHMRFSDEELVAVLKEYFGPTKESLDDMAAVHLDLR